MKNSRRRFLKQAAIAGIALGTYPSLIKDAHNTSMGMALAGGTQAADLQQGKTEASESAPGDRHPPINQLYPPEALFHDGGGGRILDVTKPPIVHW